MNKFIIKRVNEIADYIIDTEKTIRETAKIFNVSKSTVHKDVKERLLIIDDDKYNKIRKIMNEHIELRHIRGGESTRQIFLKKRQVTM